MRRFHGAIYGAARHARPYNLRSNLSRSRVHAFVLSNSLAAPRCMDPCVSEHRAIRDALEVRDRESAMEFVERHVSDACKHLTRTFPLGEMSRENVQRRERNAEVLRARVEVKRGEWRPS